VPATAIAAVSQLWLNRETAMKTYTPRDLAKALGCSYVTILYKLIAYDYGDKKVRHGRQRGYRFTRSEFRAAVKHLSGKISK